MSDKLVFDFGLHEGEDTEFYLAVGAKVVAFEANADLVERNKKRFASAIDSGQLIIEFGAIVPGDYAQDSVTFFVDKRKSVWGTTDENWVARNAALGSDVVPVTVPAVKLQEVLPKYPAPYFAKIDVEGVDQHVVQALKDTGLIPDYLSIESEKVSIDALIAEIKVLQDMGYTQFAAVQQATVPGRRIKTTGFDDQSVDYRFCEHASGPFGPYLGDHAFKSAQQVIEEYRGIFKRYRRFGDDSFLMNNPLTRIPTKIISQISAKILNAPLCGWYDTHAKK